MHVNMLVQLKSYSIKFITVELTHPDNTVGSQITPAYICLNRIKAGLSNLHMIDSPRGGLWPGTWTA